LSVSLVSSRKKLSAFNRDD